MAALNLEMLGQFQASLDGRPLTDFRTNKVQALLIYLAAAQSDAHRRDELTTLLWPGMPERSARHNLRQTVYQLRQVIPEIDAKPGTALVEGGNTVSLLVANRHAIQLNPEADISADAVRFEFLIDRTQSHDHVDLPSCRQCRSDLEEAVDLYRGDFLADFYLDDSDDYEEWSQSQRDYFRRRVLDALETLTTITTRARDYPEARALAERQLQIYDLRESAYRQLMEVLALSGHREEAMAQYDACRRVLAEELAMEPAAKTSAIYRKILDGDLSFDVPLAQRVRGYDLQQEIDAGAYGAIHLARQPGVGRQVAVKVIRRRYANDPEFIRRFEAEAHTVARLEHPFIVPLYDYWRDPDGAYLVMRYLRGGSLLASLESGAWELQPAANLLDQVASALASAHSQGVVHRDIKPANILLDESGNAYLSDFGIAKDTSAELEMTATGAVVGTLDYISPEQIKNEAVSAQTDIYSLGAVLYETLTGEKPFPDSSMASLLHSHLNEPIPLVGASRPDVPAEVDVVLQKATAKRPADRYGDALQMAEAFRKAIGGPVAWPGEIGLPEVAEVTNPYKGLRAFQEGDADDFFGRDALVEALVARLSAAGGGAAGRFLAVVGPSGSGKSSVVKAGLIPALREGAVSGSERWFVAEMVPGTHPLEELEQALWPVAVDPPPSLVEPMERDTRGLLRTISRILPQGGDTGGGHSQLLLVVDQFEELFTLMEDEARRDFFLDSLLAAITSPNSPLRVVITLRADFYDRPLQLQPLGQLLKENTEIVLPLNQAELTWAVREPARRMGVGLEAGLAETIVSDVADQPGALPLLQFAMTELFERRRDNLMTRAAYDDIGGVPGALAGRAEGLYGDLDEAGRESARQLFLRLVTLGEGVEDTRRRVLRSEIEALQGDGDTGTPRRWDTESPDHSQLAIHNSQFTIDAFGQSRLLTFDYDPATRAPTVEIAHEALLREWPRLRGWLEESRNDVRMQRLLAEAAAEWRAAEHDPGFLLREARLDQFAGWAEGSSVALTGEERKFVASSVAAREARLAGEEARRQRELETARQLAQTEHKRAEEQAQAAGQLRRRAAFLAGALVVAAILAIAALFFANQSGQNAEAAATEANQRATAQAVAEEQGMLAVAEAESRATAQVRAEASEAEAVSQREAAQSEASFRATAEAVAVQEREIAEEQIRLTTSRELALAALNNLDTDPELSVLLALEALEAKHTYEAEEVLHQAIQTSRVTGSFTPHEGYVLHLAYNDDGTRLATTGTDGVARLWDTESGQELVTFAGHSQDWFFAPDENWVDGLAYSPDGSRVASLGDDGTIRIWDPETGNELLAIESPYGWGRGDYEDFGGRGGLAFGPDGKTIAKGFPDGAHIWDAVTGEELQAVYGHDSEENVEGRIGVDALDFDPDGRLATAGVDAEALAILWDTESGEQVLTLADHNTAVEEVQFSPDGRMVATAGNDGTIRVWDSQSGETIHVLSSVGVEDIHFGADGTLLATASKLGTATVWDTATGQELITLSGHLGGLTSIAVSPSEDRVVTAGTDGTVRFWDIGPRTEARTFDLGREYGLINAIYSPDGRRLATINDIGLAHVWDAHSGEKLLTLEGHTDFGSDIIFSSDGALLVTSSDDGTAILWDAETGEAIRTYRGHEDWVNNVALSPDDSLLATVSHDNKSIIWDVDSGETLHILELADVSSAVSFSPDGTRLATGGGVIDPTIRIWDVDSGQELLALTGHEDWLNEVIFSHDGSLLISSGDDATARVWDLETGEGLLHLTETAAVREAVLSPDGQTLATGGRSDTKLWDLAAGTELFTLFEPDSTTTNLQFSADGSRLLASAYDGMIREFVLPLQELIELAESRVTRTLTDEECRQYLHLDACPAGDG